MDRSSFRLRASRFVGRAAWVWAVALPLLAPGVVMAAPLPPGASDVVARLLPEVVNISIVKLTQAPVAPGQVAPASTMRKNSLGSGFIIDPDGLIVTNKHVIEGADEITVILSDNTQLRATLLYKSPIDMAFLQVHAGHKLPAVTWGDSDKMRPGDGVIAIGNPLGLGGTVTAGIVSALDRDIKETSVDSFIQIDAAINRGNSGGPLFNLAGEVVGINTALISQGDTAGSIGLGFAIPGNDAQFVIGHFKEYGRLRAGWIGIATQVVTPDIGDGVEMPAPWGSIVTGLDPDGPAVKAGLRVGDVILRVDGNEAKEPRALNRAIATIHVGDVTVLDIWRNMAEQKLKVTVAELPSEPQQAVSAAAMAAAKADMPDRGDLGLVCAALTDADRTRLGLQKDAVGVLVGSVVHGSVAEARSVAAGQLIIKVQGEPVATPADVTRQIDAARSSNHKSVLLLFHDDDGNKFVALPLPHKVAAN